MILCLSDPGIDHHFLGSASRPVLFLQSSILSQVVNWIFSDCFPWTYFREVSHRSAFMALSWFAQDFSLNLCPTQAIGRRDLKISLRLHSESRSNYHFDSPDFIQINTGQYLWIDGWYNPSWANEELRRRNIERPTIGEDPIYLLKENKEDEAKKALAFVALLNACAKCKNICEGYRLHADILKWRLHEKNPYVASGLISMYTKCGNFAKAKQVLEDLPVRNVVIWNALIAGFAHDGQCQEAFCCFEEMQREGHFPNKVTFICILMACSSARSIKDGIEIHNEIVRRGLLDGIAINTALVDMYAKCAVLGKAQEVFNELPCRDVVTWNALIAGYAEGKSQEALDCLELMQIEGIFPNEVTFVCTLKACGSVGAISDGESIHDKIVQRGLLEKNIVLANALVDMYAKCGLLVEAQQILEELPYRDIVSWSALIAGYVQESQGHRTLHCLEQMKREGLFPNEVTLLCVLKACGNIGAVDKGKQIHYQIVNGGLLERNIALGNALVDMYARCGMPLKAQQVFEGLPVRDVVSWSSLIAGYARHGHCYEALNCFEQMQKEGVFPDDIAVLSVLNALTHSGEMNNAQTYYENMSKQYGVIPDIEHYTCMVVVFGCTGHFDRAMSMIKTLPASSHPPVWISLLNACRRWGNVKLGRMAFDYALELDCNLSAAYILMANLYAVAGMQEDAEEIEALFKKNTAIKNGEPPMWINTTGNYQAIC